MKDYIKTKFGAIAQKYDEQRRALIPCFDDFYKFLVDCVSYSSKRDRIMDIGAGTGLLTAFILEKYTESHFTLVDISEEMIHQAKIRFAGCNNISYVVDDYSSYKFEGKFDVVVSSLSIHHLENKEKQQLYKNIYLLLNKGGVFVNGDQFISRSAEVEAKTMRNWKTKIESSGLARPEIDAAYERMKLDKPATYEENIQWFEDAGFVDVDLVYKYGPFGVIIGFKR